MPITLTLSGGRGRATLAEDGTWSSPTPALLPFLAGATAALPTSWQWRDDPCRALADMLAADLRGTVTEHDRPPTVPFPPGTVV